MKNILVPIDFSDCSQNALDLALNIAKPLKAKVMVIHNFDVSVDWTNIEMLVPKDATLSEQEKQLMFPEVQDGIKAVKSKMAEIERISRERKIDLYTQIIYNSLNQDVAELAKTYNADLIVMGSHGAKGIRAFIGTFTQKVVRNSHCPVLTVKNDWPEFLPKKIVFASDFQYKNSIEYVKKVIDFSKKFGASLELLMINTPNKFLTSREQNERLKFFKSYIHSGDLNVRYYNEFSVDEGILNCLEDSDYNMIAVSTKGYKGLRGVIHESVAETVINYSTIPVMSFLEE